MCACVCVRVVCKSHLWHDEQHVVFVRGAGRRLPLRRAGDVDGLRAHPKDNSTKLLILLVQVEKVENSCLWPSVALWIQYESERSVHTIVVIV